jgi:hypothetical protein
MKYTVITGARSGMNFTKVCGVTRSRPESTLLDLQGYTMTV